MKKIVLYYLVFILALLVTGGIVSGCGDDKEEIGIGPIDKKIELKPVDNALSDKGKQIFEEKCASCHKLDDKLVGPPLKDVTKRRKPEWILNMILNPEQMTKENAAAKQLLGQYLTQMTFQNVSINDAYAILEYLRVQDGEK
jgi:mono/diheme cytochrome c family protein